MHDQVTNSRHVPNQSIKDGAKETLKCLALCHLIGVGRAWCGCEGEEGGGGTRALTH